MNWTKKQIETWLTPSERTLVDHRGNAIVLEQTQLFWEQYDFLIDHGHFTEAELIQFGHDTVEEFGLPFSLGIQDGVGHLFDSLSDESS
ncbi:hypothetical protein [Novipirellula rosea]|uniref:Uncharacterized protein n=1 Tax=Novipirellula rosea TaxID=1031540 RepID=A0ABP8NAH4_9BACT